MRKWRILTLLLAVLAVIGLPAAALWISEYKKDVTYDETVLQGDAADFSGVSNQTQNQLRDRVFWETTYRPGTGEAPETRMRFGTV
ncbi:MAG: hypothetical protein IJV64_05925 [Oscillospiraceae bacterium]|nr:hypothetical protein [Oscillospiraceae bacterium]